MANSKETIVAVSGGFDPIHIGHIELFKEAKALGDKLVVIINNDNWIKLKKRHAFMPDTERAAVIRELSAVDDVVLSDHLPGTREYSVASTLTKLKPDIFAQGGDRTGGSGEETAEEKVIKSYGGRVVYGVGKSGKIQSSSWLLSDYLKKHSAG